MLNITKKTCSVCAEVKPYLSFSRHKRHADGLNSACRACRSAHRKQAYVRLQERMQSRAWRAKTPDKQKQYSKKFRESEHGKVRIKNSMLKHSYGITLADYNILHAQQKGLCAICQNPPAVGQGKTLHVDHDHVTGTIRGLLCHHCNTALGAFGESAERLEKAIAYIQKYTEPKLTPDLKERVIL